VAEGNLKADLRERSIEGNGVVGLGEGAGRPIDLMQHLVEGIRGQDRQG
jgi:hypothetical protein